MAKKAAKKPPPRCKALLLCSQVIVDALTGRITIVSLFDSVSLPEYPGEVPAFTAFLQVTGGVGKYTMTVEVHDLRDGEVMGRIAGSPLIFHDRTACVNYAITVPPLPLAHPGRYDFVVFADDEEIDRQQFEALEGGPADAAEPQPE